MSDEPNTITLTPAELDTYCQRRIDEAVSAAYEACAKIAEAHMDRGWLHIPAAIRARGEK